MIKRLTAMTAALILIFAVGANEKREAWGEPVAVVEEPEPVAEPEATTKQYEPIIPKEAQIDTNRESDSDFDDGQYPGGETADIQVLAVRSGIDGGADSDGGDNAGSESDAPVADGTSDIQGYVDGDEDAESDAVADVGQDEVVTDPEPEPTPEPEPEPAVEPQMEYLGDWTISFYCNCPICCGSWSGGATASGAMPSAWWTVATGGLDFGTIVYVDGLGTFEVQDRGTDYGWLDVYVSSHEEALANGLQTRGVWIVR